METKYAKGTIIEGWLEEFGSKGTRKNYVRWFENYCEFVGKSPEQLVAEYKEGIKTDIDEWQRETAKSIVMFYNEAAKTHGSNIARSMSIVPRSFFSSTCTRVRIKRNKIANAIPALGQHEFASAELQKMYRLADLKGKIVISVGLSLGWGIGDFAKLKWADVEQRQPWEGFWYERSKTSQAIRCHLTDTAVADLAEWRRLNPNAIYVFEGDQKRIMRALKDVAEKAGVNGGKICFHLLRKAFYRALSNAGVDPEHRNVMTGKSVEASHLTYLQQNIDQLSIEFKRTHETYLALNGNGNGANSSNQLDELKAMITTLVGRIEALEKSSKIPMAPIVATP